MMKQLIFVMVFMTVQITQAKSFEMKSLSSSVQSTTEKYNKTLKVTQFLNSHLDIDETFLKDFKAHLKNSKTKQFLKAQLIGNTVFFKTGKLQLKLKTTEIKNNSLILMEINNHKVSLNMRDGFAKNYSLLQSVVTQKTESLWNIILPEVYAGEPKAPKELDHALSSALSWSSWAISSVMSDGKIEKEKICNLNKKEITNYAPAVSPEVLFDEIKYFVKVQNKYVKPLIQNNRDYVATGGIECNGKCEWAKEFETCIDDMAKRRKDAISSSEVYGLPCFKRYEDNGIYLSSDLLNQSLTSYDESYEAKIQFLKHDMKFECETTIGDRETATCKKKMAARLAELNSNCPPDAKTAMEAKSNIKSNALTTSGDR